MPHALTLSQLNGLVSLVFQDEFSEAYWVIAEISEAHGSSNGHFYMELMEMNEHRQILAKARATIWANTAVALQAKFQRATGQHIGAGLKVLLQVRLNFHEVYGYSLNIQDIDPAYTLGDQAQRRQQILEQLTEDGVIDLNKELPLPCPLRRIAVVSSATAAGYGDFSHQLKHSGYAFQTKLFPATMQGEQTEQSVVAALHAVYAEMEQWDAVVIIRGGGATSDLNSFDSYLLATTVAQFPLPVFTGIGHERDETIIDAVANRRFKTPTAVAAFLIEYQQKLEASLQNLEERLHHVVTMRLHQEQTLLEQVARRYQRFGHSYTVRERERILRLSSLLERHVLSALQTQGQQLSLLPLRLRQGVKRQFERTWQQLSLCEKSIAMASPERILRMGYSITTHKGKAVTTASQLKAGDRLIHRFADGEASSIVE